MNRSIVKYCKADDCAKPSWAKQLCQKHYYRLKRHGQYTETTFRDYRPAVIDGDVAKLPLGIDARLGYAIVDKEFADLDRAKWSLDGYGYPCAYIDGKVRKLHHMTLGKPPKGMVTDHINRDKLDARLSNLRFVTYKENSANIPKELFNAHRLQTVLCN